MEKNNELTIVSRVDALTVKNERDLEEATNVLSQLNQYMDQLTEEKEKVTKPLNEALKAERARFKPLEEKYSNAISAVRQKISEYATAEARRVKEAEQKIIDRVGAGKGKLSMDTAGRKINEIDKAPEKVIAGAGMVKFRTDYKLVIVKVEAIPREYMIPDEKGIKEALKRGEKIDGCVLEEVQTPINYR